MKHSHKLLALANSNYTLLKKSLTKTQTSKSATKPFVSNKVSNSNECYLENWSINNNNVDVDLKAINQMRPNLDLSKDKLNGVNINDFDIVFEETITNQKYHNRNSFLKTLI
jgi:hypothetical protein